MDARFGPWQGLRAFQERVLGGDPALPPHQHKRGPVVGQVVAVVFCADALAHLEEDLHQHVHKENNILFPKAEELEKKVSAGGDRK